MNLDAEVQLSAVVQDSSPFVIYGIKLNTEFSNHIIRKRYTDFLRFHEKLCCFSHVYCRNGTKVLDMIPKLPCQSFFYKATSQKTIQERIQALNSYVKFLIKMIDKDYDNKPWVVMIRLFLELDMIEKTQNKEVKKIQRVYKRFNELLKKREASRKKYFEIGYIVSVDQLPSSLLICIFDFLSIPSVLSIALVSRKWEKLTKSPILWRTVNLYNTKLTLELKTYETILRFDTLQTIDFRYNLQINSDVASIISQVSNPNSLNKLLLDGCQRFDDYALALLTEKFCVTFDLKSSDLKGGARGLKFLSLNECRNISDKSMTYISKLKKLETLQMRGCHITDNGTLLLISKHNSYQSLDFSGTEVSNASFLIENCPKLKYLCINTVPDFPKNLHKNISVEFIDENFEYDLIPVDISYPSRTLKSRANLTIQRLIYNIQSSLNLRHQLIIIFCNTHEIANYYTLKEVQKYHGTNDRLILQYDIKSNNSKVNKSLWASLPEWKSDSDIQTCKDCDSSFGLFKRKHHCRNCGFIFCNDCSLNRILIPATGFTRSPVRVCNSCFVKIRN